MRSRVLLPLVLGVMALHSQAQIATVQRQPDLRADVKAMPRVVAGGEITAVAAAKINASLARFDADAKRIAHECVDGKDGDIAYMRSVTVTMRGPAYLSIAASDSATCSEAHPESHDIGLVYDLKTGAPVNWEALLPQQAVGELSSTMGGLKLGEIHWPLLMKRERVLSKGANCAETYGEGADVAFAVSLSAKGHSLVFDPQLGPEWVNNDCGFPVEIHAEEARRLGVAKVLVDALVAAQP